MFEGADESVEFLLAVRDPVDAYLARDQFAAHKVVNRLRTAYDSRAAIACLTSAPTDARGSCPDVVLLDLDLPGGGYHVMRHLRDDPRTTSIPVVLLADSPAAERMLRSRRYPVQGYATKPVGFDALVSVVTAVPGLGFAMLRAR